MSNKPKSPKSGIFKRRAMERAEVYAEGYHKGQTDLMLNIAPEQRKLNAEATAIVLSTAATAREFGDKRLAFILDTLMTWAGDPELVSKLTKESKTNDRIEDIADLA